MYMNLSAHTISPYYTPTNMNTKKKKKENKTKQKTADTYSKQ